MAGEGILPDLSALRGDIPAELAGICGYEILKFMLPMHQVGVIGVIPQREPEFFRAAAGEQVVAVAANAERRGKFAITGQVLADEIRDPRDDIRFLGLGIVHQFVVAENNWGIGARLVAIDGIWQGEAAPHGSAEHLAARGILHRAFAGHVIPDTPEFVHLPGHRG